MTRLFLVDGAFWLALAATALAASGARGRGPARWALPVALALLTAQVLLPSRALLSFGVSLAAVGVAYALRPYRSAVPLATALLATPALRYVDAVGGFELRLWLSAHVGRLLRLLGRDLEVVGNAMLMEGTRFTVDAECVGVQLLLTGLCVAAAAVAVVERRRGVVIAPWAVVGAVALAVGFVTAANLTRILVLVWMGWGPTHIAHEWVGLACFAAYVLAPLAAGAWWLGGHATTTGVRAEGRPRRISGALAVTAAIPLAVGMLRTPPTAPAVRPPAALVGVEGVPREDGVTAYRLDDALVYVKPVRSFYVAEHSPAVCWRGSGYRFRAVERRAVGEAGEVFAGVLERDGQRLFTAWWMSDGRRATLDQVTWRLDMAGGGPAYALVNVTAADEAALWSRVASLYGAREPR